LAVLAYLRAGTIPVQERHMGSLEKTFGDL
jgi:hypothetical protein